MDGKRIKCGKKERRKTKEKTHHRKHASVYMGGLRTIIQSMSDEDELILQMIRIAKAHKKWNVQRRHVVVCWKTFYTTVMRKSPPLMPVPST
ncbi:hypothetical protein KIN20_033027 [Parelaphostrongylus tenuis]|uniref:Uncharacterized protein n=1 Tax=Parelaphostrongylus tenuis TaxID=148309 RepID=A0AAD5R808_PARTN|nr:hypothetical protein KIN20_033027 [Parelaphostrongylus tenuis]